MATQYDNIKARLKAIGAHIEMIEFQGDKNPNPTTITPTIIIKFDHEPNLIEVENAKEILESIQD